MPVEKWEMGVRVAPEREKAKRYKIRNLLQGIE